MLADEFSRIFREEHRKVRDGLLDLIQAFQERDKARIGSLLGEIATYVGPHFRYEEEALYPSLVEIYGAEYIEKLLSDHDRVIGTAKRLVELAGKETLSEGDVTEATRLVRGILPHVSDCDGLSLMTERLSEDKVQRVLETRDRSLAAGLNLLQWAEQIRRRPAA